MYMYTHMHTHMDIFAIIHSKLAVESAHRFCVDHSGRSFMCCQDMSLPTYPKDESLGVAQVVKEDKALCKVQR